MKNMVEVNERVLVVEDEIVIALDISYTLRDFGYQVLDPVMSAEAALSLLEKEHVDLVLMDIHLKGKMTGIDAAVFIRERFGIPVVFLTAFADELTIAHARVAEPYGYILKPYTKQDLNSNIKIALFKHQAEKKIRDSELRWQSLAANTPNIIVVIDADEKVQYINRASAFVEQVGEIDIYAYVLPEYKEILHLAIKEGFQGESPSNEICVKIPDGNLRYFGTQISPIFENGMVTAVTLIATDLTTRKQAESDREKYIAELAAKNEELDRFTYTISHDLKAPITTIQGFLGYLKSDITQDPVRALHDMERIEQAVDKMHTMVTELLEISRVGRVVKPPVEVLFSSLVEDAIKLLDGRINKYNIRVLVEPNLPRVFGDYQRLLQVMQNLIDNSAKYMGPQIEPLVEIGVKECESEMPVFYVRDNGIGVAPEHHERIFDLFGKLDVNVEGSGIGLALVKKIIEYHGGRIWLESEVGKGTTFYFTLPKVK